MTRSAHATGLCFAICRFSQVVFILRAQPHAQSLFLFPIVFDSFFFFDRKKDGAAEHSMTCSVLRSLVAPFERGRMKSVNFTKSANFLATERGNSAPFERGGTGVQILATESANSSPISAPQWWPSEKGETKSAKGEMKSANFWQGKV